MNLDQAFHYQMAYAKKSRDMTRRPAQPRRFPARPEAELILSGELAEMKGTLAEALSGQARALSHAHDLQALATVAQCSLGLTRYEPSDPYALHRPSPAPRCLHTTTLYWLSDGQVLPRDLYLYHPVRHSFEPLQCPADTLPQGGPAWLISLDTRRLAFKYGDFAERLGRLEAGHVVTQVQACLTLLGWESQVQWPQNAPLPALPGEEQVVVMIPYQPAQSKPAGVQASPSAALQTSFRQCMQLRESGFGPRGVHPRAHRIQREEVSEAARLGLGAVTPDVQFGLRAVVLNVEGLERGIYECATDGSLRWVRTLAAEQEFFPDLFLGSGFRTDLCPVVWFITAPVSDAFGGANPDAYSALMIGAGMIAQRLELHAAAKGQFARPCMNFDEAGMDYHLGCSAAGDSVLCQILVGFNSAKSLSLPLATGLPS